MRPVLLHERRDERVELTLRKRPVDVVVERILGVVLLDGLDERALDLGVEDDPTGSRQEQIAVPAELDRLLQFDLLGVDRVLDLLFTAEPIGLGSRSSAFVLSRSVPQYVR
jgi:hypothetical protein